MNKLELLTLLISLDELLDRDDSESAKRVIKRLLAEVETSNHSERIKDGGEE